ncbi:MAG: hypothetical protein OXQ93_06735 [Gemmatimonadota bacterium]|nr:hypothetical protein [Gemmatimonadota bacterium]
MVEGQVAGGLGLARDRDLDGAPDGGRVEAELLGGAALPVRVAIGEVRLGGEEVGGGREEGCGEEGGSRQGRGRAGEGWPGVRCYRIRISL